MNSSSRLSVVFVGESDAYDVHRRALSALPRSFWETSDFSADIAVVDAASTGWSAAVLERSASTLIVANPWSATSDELVTVADACTARGVVLLPDASSLIEVERFREDLLHGTKTDPILSADLWFECALQSQEIWLGSLIAQELALLRTIGLMPTTFGRVTQTTSGIVLLTDVEPTVITLSGVILPSGISRFEMALLTSSTRRSLAYPLSGPVSPSRLELDSAIEQRRNRPLYTSGARLFWLSFAGSATLGASSSYEFADWLSDLRTTERHVPRQRLSRRSLRSK